MTYDEFLTFRSISMLAPGANSPNLSVLIGRHLGGPVGAAFAFLASTVPGVLTILVFGILALNPKLGLSAALRGFAAAAVGLSFANAIGVAVDMKLNGFLDQIRGGLDRLKSVAPVPPQSAAF